MGEGQRLLLPLQLLGILYRRQPTGVPYYASSPHLTSSLASSIRAQAYVSGFTYSLCPNYMLQAQLPPITAKPVRPCVQFYDAWCKVR